MQASEGDAPCKVNRLKWCHTDLGATAYRWRRLVEEDRRFGGLDKTGVFTGQDGVMAGQVVEAGWPVDHAEGRCLFDQGPSPQMCAYNKGAPLLLCGAHTRTPPPLRHSHAPLRGARGLAAHVRAACAATRPLRSLPLPQRARLGHHCVGRDPRARLFAFRQRDAHEADGLLKREALQSAQRYGLCAPHSRPGPDVTSTATHTSRATR